MNALLKPLLATLTLAAVAYGSHAQTQSTPVACRGADAAATCGAEPRPHWMGVDANGADTSLPAQRSAAEAAPTARDVKRASAAQPSSSVITTAGTASTSTLEADASSTAESHTIALILAALGVIGLISRRRFDA